MSKNITLTATAEAIDEMIDLLQSGEGDLEGFQYAVGAHGYRVSMGENEGMGEMASSAGYSDPPEIAQADHDEKVIQLVWL